MDTQQRRYPIVELRDVCKKFPGVGRQAHVEALRNISLTIDGEADKFVVLLGPSGCGKSTLLGLISGLQTVEKVNGGQVLVFGEEVTGPNSKSVTVPQAYTCFPWLTALKNVEFGLIATDLPPHERQRTATEYLGKVGLGNRLHARPRQLSGGMQQRVAIARALALKRPLLLMDEPFGALDAQIRVDMQQMLLELWEQERNTIIFVTHDISEALLLADRIIVLSANPAQIVRDIRVPFSRPRVPEIAQTPQFCELSRNLLTLLKAKPRIQAQPGGGDAPGAGCVPASGPGAVTAGGRAAPVPMAPPVSSAQPASAPKAAYGRGTCVERTVAEARPDAPPNQGAPPQNTSTNGARPEGIAPRAAVQGEQVEGQAQGLVGAFGGKPAENPGRALIGPQAVAGSGRGGHSPAVGPGYPAYFPGESSAADPFQAQPPHVQPGIEPTAGSRWRDPQAPEFPALPRSSVATKAKASRSRAAPWTLSDALRWLWDFLVESPSPDKSPPRAVADGGAMRVGTAQPSSPIVSASPSSAYEPTVAMSPPPAELSLSARQPAPGVQPAASSSGGQKISAMVPPNAQVPAAMSASQVEGSLPSPDKSHSPAHEDDAGRPRKRNQGKGSKSH
jgi:ABC-type nitrate/sulfonate/bicarbonate transport system ATPase subunit